MGVSVRSGTAQALIAHRQSDKDIATKVNATVVGELVVNNGAKTMAITRNGDNTIATLALIYDVDGSDVTRTYTFTYSGGLIAGFTTAIS